jgi:hypothetical protein
MIFVARGEIKVDELDKVFAARKTKGTSKRVHVITEVFVVGQPWVIAVFEAETVEDVVDFISPYLSIGTFDISPAMTADEAQKLF